MAEKICIDTDIIITILKGGKESNEVVNKFLEYEVFITAISVFELSLRRTNLEIIDELINHVKVLPLDEYSAKKASELHKFLSKKGNIIDLRDLFISAICLTHDVKLATKNKKHFEIIPELKLEDW